jgi:hypothetical protein
MSIISIVNGDVQGLRNAVASACEFNGGAVTIDLAPNGLYLFTNGPYDLFHPTALLICGAVSIRGNGATLQRDSNGPAFRLIGVTDQGWLTLDNATLRGGRMDGNGGAAVVIVGGTALLSNVLVDDNDVNDPQLGVGFLSSGGALYNYFGTLTLEGVTIRNSNMRADLGGGAINSWGGTLTMRRSLITNNTSFNAGGGLFIQSPAAMTLEYNEITGNSAPDASALRFQTAPVPTARLNFNCLYGNSGTAVTVPTQGQVLLNARQNWWNGNPSVALYVDTQPAIFVRPETCTDPADWHAVLATPTPEPTATEPVCSFTPVILVFGGSNGVDITQPFDPIAIGLPEQIPAWVNDQTDYDVTEVIRYTGSKRTHALAVSQDYKDADILLIGFSAGADSAIMYAYDYVLNNVGCGRIRGVASLGGTMSGVMIDNMSNLQDVRTQVVDQLLLSGVDLYFLDDSAAGGDELANYTAPPAIGSFQFVSRVSQEHWQGGYPGTGTNNSDIFRQEVLNWFQSN